MIELRGQLAMKRVSNDMVATPLRIGVQSSGNSCDHVGLTRCDCRQELVQPRQRSVDDVVHHDHGPRKAIDVAQRPIDPTVLIVPIVRQRVPQHARVSRGAQGSRRRTSSSADRRSRRRRRRGGTAGRRLRPRRLRREWLPVPRRSLRRRRRRTERSGSTCGRRVDGRQQRSAAPALALRAWRACVRSRRTWPARHVGQGRRAPVR